MRISNEYMTNNLMKNLNDNRERLDRYNEQLSTGKQFDLPSDNPTGVATSIDLRSKIDQNTQHISNLSKGISWAETTDSALNQAGKVLQRAKELAVQGANGSLSKTDREAIADEIIQLRDNLAEVANTSYNDRYIFSGNKTEIKPYQEEESHISTSREVDNPNSSLGYEGEFEISFNGKTAAIDIASNDSLKDVKEKINSNLDLYSAGISSNPADLDNAGASDDVFADTNADGNIDGIDYDDDGSVDETGNDPDSDGIKESLDTDGSGPGGAQNFETIASNYSEVDAEINDNNQLVINGHNLDSVLEIENTGGPDNIVQKLDLQNKDYIYQGDKGNITREISSGSNLDINQTGEYFEKPLANLKRLANNLRSGEATRISEDNIENLDQNIDELLSMRSEVGAKQKRMEMTRNRLESDKIKLKELKSENEDVNIAETIMDLKMSENVYRAALSSGSRIIQPSLVDFIN
mgnify:FL=1